MHPGRIRDLFLIMVVGSLLAACGQLRDFGAPARPDLSEQWKPLLDELRAFERTIGFRETPNFARLSNEREAYAYCGHASRHVLPYSYEDPVIEWLEQIDAEECRELGADRDWYFGQVEVWGEIGTPVTPAMISGDLDRFVYLVIHEDCHDQFTLPYGIEEPLCNIITYRAMAQFAARKYRWYSRENRAIRNYGLIQSRQTRATVVQYRTLENLYARYQKKELPLEDLLQARANVFAAVERALELPPGEINNISLANLMTYSRHYGYLESIVDRLGPDLARVVAFFRAVDAAKPKPEALMEARAIKDRKSLEFVRTYEQATLDTIARALVTRTASVRETAPAQLPGTTPGSSVRQ